jgi:hypothetical protein
MRQQPATKSSELWGSSQPPIAANRGAAARGALAYKLRNVCFVQGISSDSLQTIVHSRNGSTFKEIAETAVEEESAIFSKNERYRQGANAGSLVCHNCGKMGHVATKCYLKKKTSV